MVRQSRIQWFALIMGLLSFLGGATLSAASQEKFDYDPLGRLIRYVDSNGKVTEYRYDAVGNILAVDSGVTAAAPSVSSVSGNRLRRNTSVEMVIQGVGFTGARLQSLVDGVAVSDAVVASNQIRATLSADSEAPLGQGLIRLENSIGSLDVAINVDPQLPSYQFFPIPVAIPPNGVAQTVSIQLSNSDTTEHQFSLSVDDAAMATVFPEAISVPAGANKTQITLKGLTPGVTTLRASSATLGPAAIPVFVTAEFSGVNTSYAAVVGVDRLSANQPSNGAQLLLSPPINVVVGAHFDSVIPAAWSRGQGLVDVTITGEGLEGVSGVRVDPSQGIDLGNLIVAPSGKAITLTAKVDSDAAFGVRRIILEGAGGAYKPSKINADRIAIVQPKAEIWSISPIVGVPGQAGIPITIRGVNLNSVSRLVFEPGTGITVDSQLVINAEGSELTSRIGISDDAPPMAHVARVGSDIEMSSGLASPSNTFTVGNEVSEINTPILAPAVGVTKETSAATQNQEIVVARPINVALGGYVDEMAPRAFTVGQGAAQVLLRGGGLEGVTSASFEPPGGIEVLQPQISNDGKTVVLPINIPADATVGIRKLILKGSGEPYYTVPAHLNKIEVTYPIPEIDSIEPIVGLRGEVLSLTVRGRNMQGVTAATLLPGTGIAISSTLTKADDGSSVIVSLSISPDAPAGAHVLQLVSPVGTTTAQGGLANTFTVAPEALVNVSPLTSNLVGVVRGSVQAPEGFQTWSPMARISVGPVVTGISQAIVVPGTTIELVLHGVGLQGIDSVSLAGAEGLSLGSFKVSDDGTSIILLVTVAIDAALGQRTIRLAAGGTEIPFLFAHDERIDVQVPSSSLTVSPLISPIVGIERQRSGGPTGDQIDVLASQSTIALPPYFRSIQHPPLIRGQSVDLTILGDGLELVTGLSLRPGDGVAVASQAVSPDGKSMTATLTITPDAAIGGRLVELVSAADPIPPVTPTAAKLSIAAGTPEILSIAPIVVRQGETIELIVRGTNLHDVAEVRIEPSEGIQSIGTPIVNGDGTEVRASVYVLPSAALGARVVRVDAAGGLTTDVPAPANTLTIFSN